ncbi:DUF2846 domain-containing protein [Salegentibacter mishustinae]|jgi:hypothetical protein|uniref:DUF2846 domain-containing protein n=1 Tax=Salegentibacter mishustinae TaxID=270918 RepID=UPI001CE05DE2|nr:DUF2846 domain-containing protein [Salegentibacter mishustinae]UBZ06760.1 DUF2846 domain-containing protein [Salegentibacter mishustinae]
MKNIVKICYFIVLLVLISCSNSKHIPERKKYDNIKIVGINDTIVTMTKPLGKIDIGFNFFYQNCGWEQVMKEAEAQARELGGNVIKITEHNPVNNLNNTCHSIKADVYKISKSSKIFNKDISTIDSIIGDHTAEIKVYRYSGASLFKYNLYLNDSLIGKVSSNYKRSFKIKEAGNYKLSVGRNKKEEVNFKINPGNTYYFKIDIGLKFFVERPQLKRMSKKQGKVEFESFIAKNP